VSAAGNKRYQEIVAAAAQIFRRQGYAQTSVQDVADAVGLLKGSLYYHIDTKEDLLYAVLTTVHEEMSRISADVEQMEGTPVERLREYIRRHLEYMAENTVNSYVYYQDLHQLAGQRLQAIVAARKEHEQLVVSLIAAGQRAGEIDETLDPKVVAFLLFGAMNWACMWYDADGPVGPDELVRIYCTTILRGICREAEPLPRRAATTSSPGGR